MKRVPVKIKLLDKDLLPEYKTKFASGMDLRAYDDVHLKPGEIKCIRTGVFIELPIGYEAQVRPRSGLALKYGVTVLNTPGTVDADYRGEIKVILVNFGTETFSIKRGDRIAQLVINEVVQADLEIVDELKGSERGAGGFGSTGID